MCYTWNKNVVFNTSVKPCPMKGRRIRLNQGSKLTFYWMCWNPVLRNNMLMQFFLFTIERLFQKDVCIDTLPQMYFCTFISPFNSSQSACLPRCGYLPFTARVLSWSRIYCEQIPQRPRDGEGVPVYSAHHLLTRGAFLRRDTGMWIFHLSK